MLGHYGYRSQPFGRSRGQLSLFCGTSTWSMKVADEARQPARGRRMRLYEVFQDTGFHTTLMTTFCVDFDAFESIVLSRLRGAGCRNVMLVCDADMVSLLRREPSRRAYVGGYAVAQGRQRRCELHDMLVLVPVPQLAAFRVIAVPATREETVIEEQWIMRDDPEPTERDKLFEETHKRSMELVKRIEGMMLA